jgi:hypothetical protein
MRLCYESFGYVFCEYFRKNYITFSLYFLLYLYLTVRQKHTFKTCFMYVVQHFYLLLIQKLLCSGKMIRLRHIAFAEHKSLRDMVSNKIIISSRGRELFSRQKNISRTWRPLQLFSSFGFWSGIDSIIFSFAFFLYSRTVFLYHHHDIASKSWWPFPQFKVLKNGKFVSLKFRKILQFWNSFKNALFNYKEMVRKIMWQFFEAVELYMLFHVEHFYFL